MSTPEQNSSAGLTQTLVFSAEAAVALSRQATRAQRQIAQALRVASSTETSTETHDRADANVPSTISKEDEPCAANLETKPADGGSDCRPDSGVNILA